MSQEHKFLSDEAQRNYLRQAQSEDNFTIKEIAINEIINNNFKLLCSLVQRFCGRGIEREDLMQIAMIGLLKAIKNFNLDCQNKFSTYAVPMIVGELKRALRDDQPIHVSRSYKETGYKVYRAREAFVNANNREPTIKELAKEVQLSPEVVAVALEANRKPTSLQMPLDNNSEKINELQDIIKCSDGEEKWVANMTLENLFAILDTRLKYIMVARYYREETQQQIADKLKISQVQVSRLEKQALAQMRNYLKAE